jgi:hypothetical protein
MGSQPWCTKIVSDFDETFSVYRAFNVEHFDKNKFQKSFCYHGDILKIFLWKNAKKWSFLGSLELWFFVVFSTKAESKLEYKTIFGILVRRRTQPHQI